MWKWKEESGSTITNQMRRIGAAADWSRERFTMDEGLSAAVRKVFIDWYRAGLIYRGNRLVNWDPVLGTAVSDLEVVSEEEDGFLWHILYPFTEGPIGNLNGLTVATTRPETMLGDVAVMVHPEDERYAHLIGKTVRLPLTERDIPIGIVGGSILAMLLPIAGLLWYFASGTAIASGIAPTILGTLIYVVLIGAVIACVCGYMAGLIGASNSPVSGVGILAALGSALYQLSRKGGDSKKMIRALAIRVGLSIALFLLLMILWKLGIIAPHGLNGP